MYVCLYDCVCILYQKKIHTYFQCSQFLPPKIVFSTQFFGWLYPIPCDQVIRSAIANLVSATKSKHPS